MKRFWGVIILVLVIGACLWVFKFKNPHDEIQDKRKPASVSEDAIEKSHKPKLFLHVHHFSTTGVDGYGPTQLKTAYEMNTLTAGGAGQTIALIEASGNPNIQNDLNVFDTNFKLAKTTVSVFYPQGKPSTVDQSWALETSLDVEWAHAIAPKAKIMLVVAQDDTYDDLMNCVDFAISSGATQVSMSWGSTEWAGETGFDFHFDVTKASFFASSGDSGAGAQWPASSPYVTGVGGTTLSLNSSGSRTSAEMAWTGSGGGQSAYEPEPSFQSHFQSSGFRTVPDVSYNADPNTGYAVYDSYGVNGSSGWFQVGGTSAGAPQWAALAALIGSSTAKPLGSIGANIYSLVTPKNLTTYFYDVSGGCDGSNTSQDCAHHGYDEVTGLGTPISNKLSKGVLALY